MKYKWNRNCPLCGILIAHKSKKFRDAAVKTNRQCLQCAWNKQKRKIPYERNCPNCNKVLKYKYSSNYFAAFKINSLCNKCSKINKTYKKTIKSKWIKLCPICTNNQYYSRYDALQFAIKNNSKCKNCADKDHRIFMINSRNNQYPRYNKKACRIFDEINKELRWNGVHAENGGEYNIKELGYWVDYYEPNLNIIIEYDEMWHNNKNQKKKDIMRQKEIIKYLGCTFYRLSENTSWRTIIHV